VYFAVSIVQSAQSRFREIILSIIVALTVGISIPVISANAASWHRGTPRALRGKFQAVKKNSPAEGFKTEYIMSSDKMVIYSSGMPVPTITHFKYRKIGSHKYELKGHMKRVGNSILVVALLTNFQSMANEYILTVQCIVQFRLNTLATDK